MKTLHGIIILIFTAAIIACSSNDKQENRKKLDTGVVKNTKSATAKNKAYEVPRIKFEETVYDFGRIIQGEKVAYDFHFVNSGKSELVITKVKSSCGCTVSKYPREAIFPGEKGKIEVVFDSKGKRGFQNKSITILANTQPNATKLNIKGIVTVPEKN